MTPAEIERAGMFAAGQALRRYKVPLDRWVDVFATLRAANMMTMFRPLRRMSGAILHGDDVASGVLINSNHPLSRQRMTAAHELGHLEFGHQSVIDILSEDDFELPTMSQTKEERLAESFARWFLMPHPLIDYAMHALALDALVTPGDVYRLSLYLGTSYQATAAHVVAAKRASRERSTGWLKERPAQVKGPLCEGLSLGDARADVHVLHDFESGTSRLARQGDLFILKLAERPTTGYRWVLSAESQKLFDLVTDDYVEVPPDEDVTGGGCVRRFGLRVRELNVPYADKLMLHNVREWDALHPVQTFAIDLQIETLHRIGIPNPEEYLVAA